MIESDIILVFYRLCVPIGYPVNVEFNYASTKKVEKERLEQLLIEGLDSGKSIEVTDEWWENRRNELIQKANHSY